MKTSSPKINLPKLTAYITTQNMLSKRRGRFLEELTRQLIKNTQKLGECGGSTSPNPVTSVNVGSPATPQAIRVTGAGQTAGLCTF